MHLVRKTKFRVRWYKAGLANYKRRPNPACSINKVFLGYGRSHLCLFWRHRSAVERVPQRLPRPQSHYDTHHLVPESANPWPRQYWLWVYKRKKQVGGLLWVKFREDKLERARDTSIVIPALLFSPHTTPVLGWHASSEYVTEGPCVVQLKAEKGPGALLIIIMYRNVAG